MFAGLAALSKILAPNPFKAFVAFAGSTDPNLSDTFVIPSFNLDNKAWIVEL